MKPLNHTENRIRHMKPDVQTPASMDSRILMDAYKAMPETQAPKENPGFLRRNLMKNPLKLTAAAAILIAATLLLTYLDTPAYAVEQTIRAMRNITTVHFWARDWQDREMEVWIKVNPETGGNDCHYVHDLQRGQISISTPERTYFYHTTDNVVRVVEGQALRSDLRFGRYIEDVMDKMVIPEQGQIQITHQKDAETGQPNIILWAGATTFEMQATIDPETKLPIKMSFEKACDGQTIKNIDRISYNEPLPEGLFDFDIPKDAQVIHEVINQQKVLCDPYYGISADGLSNDEARIRLIEEFWEFVINTDYENAHRLLPVASVEQIKAALESLGGAAEELVSIGEPFEDPDIHLGSLTPVRVRFANQTVIELYQIVHFRTLDGKTSCVLAGEGQKAKIIE